MPSEEQESQDSKVSAHSLIRWLPLILFFAAFGLRLLGIGWGLPNELHNQSYHPDEQVIWGYSQQIEPTKLKFTPGFYNYGTLYLTVLRVASDVVAGYGAGPKEGDPSSLWSYLGACHLAGRVISALCGALAVVFVFLIGRRFTNVLGASLGSLALAVSPAFVVHSRFQTVDVMATMLLAASLWFAVRILDDLNPTRCTLWAGVFAGLSAGTKYTGILVLLPILLALFLRSREDKSSPWKSMGIATGMTLLAFVIATPGSILESANFMKDVKYEMLHTSTGHGLLFEGVAPGYWYHLGNLGQGMGPILLVMGISALVWACMRREKWALVLLAFGLPYYILIGRAEVLFMRYTFPMMVIFTVAFAWLIGQAHEKKGKSVALVVLGILGVGHGLSIAMGFTTWMTRRDPRDEAALVLKQLATESTTVGIATDPWFYTPPLIPDSASMRGQMPILFQEMAESKKPQLVRYLPADPTQRYDWDVRLLSETKPDYVVFSSLEIGPLVRLSDTTGKYVEVDRFKEFIAALEKDYSITYGPRLLPGTTISQRYLTAGLLVEDMAYARPLVWIWKRN